jgi:hypothetical protein
MVVSQARKAIESYFDAFNKRDSKAIAQTLHFPHIRINSEGRINIMMDPMDVVQFNEMVVNVFLERDDWAYSTLDSVEVVHESDVKVHFRIVFSRFKKDDSRYAVINSLWIVTLRDDEWKILARSSYSM